MKMRVALLLPFLGWAAGSSASGGDGAISLIRARRAESNAAIAAHDAARLRKLFDDQYHAILGSTGDVDSGGDAATRGYADEEFKDPTFVSYRRTSTSIVIATSGRRIAETGRFEGVWKKPDGTMRRTGVYLAMWVPGEGGWRLKSEAFVTLACVGSVACEKVG
jgi:hypothetical protein